jgi:type III secretion system YscD/HrpQ family protein
MKIEPHLEQMVPLVELRVLYGPQAGSRLTLSPGVYLLGTGDDCEVMLSGPRMRESHASLNFNGEALQISPSEGDVCDIHGTPLDEAAVLTLGMPFELGGVWLTIDSTNSPWPEAEAIAAMAGLAQPTPSAEGDPPVDASIDSAAPVAPPSSRSPLAVRIAMATIAFIGIATLGLSTWFLHDELAANRAPARAAEAAQADDQGASLRALLARIAPDMRIDLRRMNSGGLELVGYAPDQASRDRVIDQVRKVGGVENVQIYADSELLASVQKIVASRNHPQRMVVSVSSLKNGRADITGAVANANMRDALIEAIRNEVPGVHEVTGSLRSIEDLASVFEERLISSGLSGKLQVLDRQPEFVVRGRLVDADIDKWERVILSFHEEFAAILPIRATLTTLQRKPPIEVQMIVGGTMPFIVTENGQKVGRGGDAGGHVLSIVRDNEVVFDGAERFRIGR